MNKLRTAIAAIILSLLLVLPASASYVGTAPLPATVGGTGLTTGLTALNATNLTSGTVPDARFPATLPAASGVNLTALNATNLGSGSVPAARFGSNTVPDAALSTNVPLLNATNSFSNGSLLLSNATTNWFDCGNHGTGLPVVNTHNTGTKLILYNQAGGGNTDYAIGVSTAGVVWAGCASASAGQGFAWYGGVTNLMSLDAASGKLTTTGDVIIGTVGKKLQIKEGSNASMGRVTLVAGTATVSNTLVTANSEIFLTEQTAGGTIGAPGISARSAGTSFTITSTNALDTSIVAWHIIEPAP